MAAISEGGTSLKLLFFSYRKLSLIILLSFFTLLCASLYYSSARFAVEYTPAMFTFSNVIRSYRTVSIDINGNGKKDMLEIGINPAGNQYTMEIKNDDGTKYFIVPGKDEKTACTYYSSWPLQVTVSDINRDKVPEIIAQVPKNEHEASISIFRWNGKEYAKILSGPWAGISLSDVNSDNRPEIITSEGLSGYGYSFHTYSWDGSNYNRTDDKTEQTEIGYDRLNAINCIMDLQYDEKNFNNDFLSYCFTDSALKDEKNIDALKDFIKNSSSIQMQDYISEAIQGKKKSDSLVSLWKIRYIAYKKIHNQLNVKNYVAEIEMTRLNGYYKINKIKIKGDSPIR